MFSVGEFITYPNLSAAFPQPCKLNSCVAMDTCTKLACESYIVLGASSQERALLGEVEAVYVQMERASGAPSLSDNAAIAVFP